MGDGRKGGERNGKEAKGKGRGREGREEGKGENSWAPLEGLDFFSAHFQNEFLEGGGREM